LKAAVPYRFHQRTVEAFAITHRLPICQLPAAANGLRARVLENEPGRDFTL